MDKDTEEGEEDEGKASQRRRRFSWIDRNCYFDDTDDMGLFTCSTWNIDMLQFLRPKRVKFNHYYGFTINPVQARPYFIEPIVEYMSGKKFHEILNAKLLLRGIIMAYRKSTTFCLCYMDL